MAKKKFPAPICPYCGKPARYADSKEVYRKSYGYIWLCVNYPACDSYVGVHAGGQRQPLGRMANRELREAKKAAHAAFDPIWKFTGRRNEGYKWLAAAMGLTRETCHIGMFDVEQCRRVVVLCEELKSKPAGVLP